jgi:hypothetical protein
MKVKSFVTVRGIFFYRAKKTTAADSNSGLAVLRQPVWSWNHRLFSFVFAKLFIDNDLGGFRESLAVFTRAAGVYRRAVGVYRRAVGVYRRAAGVYRRAAGVYRRAAGVYCKTAVVYRKTAVVYPRAAGL